MTLRALVTRPEADAAPVAEALRAQGLEVTVEPLLAIRPLPDAAVELDGVQALLFTSANGVRVFAERSAERGLPAFAVGKATAEAARAAGFARVESAGGDVHDLARLVRDRLAPEDGPLLHIAGSAVAGDLAGMLAEVGFEVRRAVLYEAEPAERLTPAVEQALADGAFDFVLFFSSRTADSFVRLVRHPPGDAGPGDAGEDAISADRLAAGCARAEALCLSLVVAEAADGLPWRRVRTAARPDLPAMLELAELAAAEARATTEEDMDETKDRPHPSTTEDSTLDSNAGDRPSPEPIPGPASGSPSDPDAAGPWAGPAGPAPRPAGRSAGPLALAAAALALLALALVLTEPWWSPLLGPPWAPREAAAPASETGPATGGQAEETATRLATAETWLSQLADKVAAIDGRLAALSDEIAALRSEVSAAGPAGEPALPPEIAGLPDRLDALERRIAEAAAAAERPAAPAPETTEALAQLRAETERLRNALAAAQERLAALPGLREEIAAAETTAARRAEQAALLLAAAELRSALAGDRPFATELGTVRRFAGEDGSGLADTIEPLIAPVADRADTGIPTLADLRAAFPEVARAVVEAGQAAAIGAGSGEAGPGGEAAPTGWVDRTLARLASLVTVRPVGDAVEGEGPAARVARAEARLAEGDLRTAIAELSALDGAPAQAVAGWLADARARLAADEAAAALQTAVVGGLASPPDAPSNAPSGASPDTPSAGSAPRTPAAPTTGG